jgi:hypothetical protein
VNVRDGDRQSFGSRNATVYIYANEDGYVELEFIRPFLVSKRGIDELADWLRNELHESVDAIEGAALAELLSETDPLDELDQGPWDVSFEANGEAEEAA